MRLSVPSYPRSPGGEKIGKGVTLSKEELLALKELLNKMELN
jgi:hypothetical protein